MSILSCGVPKFDFSKNFLSYRLEGISTEYRMVKLKIEKVAED